MKDFKQFICPVSPERVDENKVRLTALWVVMLMGSYFFTGYTIFPLLVAVDFYIRAFTRFTFSPLSYLSHRIVHAMGLPVVRIDKAPKIFAARIGFMLTTLTSLFAMLGFFTVSLITGSILVVFAFLECGLNFCAGCWVYTYVVYPLVRDK